MAKRTFGNRKHRERVTKHIKCTVNLDRNTPEYWERLLRRNKLSMNRGTSKRLVYGHELTRLDYDGVRTYAITESLRGMDSEPPDSP